MPKLIETSWFMKYGKNAGETTRLLVSLPEGMLRDAETVARIMNISSAELVRRALTRHMAEFIRNAPDLVKPEGTLRR